MSFNPDRQQQLLSKISLYKYIWEKYEEFLTECEKGGIYFFSDDFHSHKEKFQKLMISTRNSLCEERGE